jgi:hypothetical protein
MHGRVSVRGSHVAIGKRKAFFRPLRKLTDRSVLRSNQAFEAAG